MNNKTAIEFNKNIRKINKYRRKLLIKTKNNKTIGSINEWIFDNYYVVVEREQHIRNECNTFATRKIRNERKRELYNLVRDILKLKDFDFNIAYLYKKLNRFQEKEKDYFSYAEINYMYTLIAVIMVEELARLIDIQEHKLTIKTEIEKKIKKLELAIKNEEAISIENYFNFNMEDIKNPYYILEINYYLKKLEDFSEEAFIKINEKLADKNNIRLKDQINLAHNELAHDNFLVANVFNSLKKVEKIKLGELYKHLSYAEKALLGEEAGVYQQMYDNNKTECRRKIIRESKKQKISEYKYVDQLVRKANKEKKHVGWYLYNHIPTKKRTKVYIGSIVLLTAIVTMLTAIILDPIIIVFLIVPISILVIEVINQIIMIIYRPTSLFKIKFDKGLPEEYSTMVTIPSILKDKNKIDEMFNNLEIYYLANKSDNLYFTLIGDATSETEKTAKHDPLVIEIAKNKVKELNDKYEKEIFHFIYRHRFYNEGEGYFLGYERKRGGLTDLNKLLLGKYTEAQKTKYFQYHTLNNFKKKIKYVITLDPDTQLILNSAIKMVGAMVHPLNIPILNREKTKVVSGYGVMQPRIGIDIEVTNKSAYSQLFAGLGGLDIYTKAAFDVYQNYLGEGIFAGKGIYDLEVFDTVLSKPFPENIILSHDLIESTYIRCGFINDVELFDDYPADYINDSKRHRRWNRGDWQIVSWLKNKHRNAANKIVINPISNLSKWKIFDNIRRSMRSFFLLIILFYGLTIGTAPANQYFLLSLLVIAIPILFYLIAKFFRPAKKDFFLKYYLNLIRGIFSISSKSVVILMTLPYDAYLYADSAIRSIYRMLYSKKNLLNWVPAYEQEKIKNDSIKKYLNKFQINFIFAAALLLLSWYFKPAGFSVAVFISILWLSAPFILYRLSFPYDRSQKQLVSSEKEEIRDIAVKTWKYFETLIKEENNFLIPDNYQINRNIKEDKRTSPTAIGFSLISIISAFEIGSINLKKANQMIENTLITLGKLEKWHGHLFNWYNIKKMNKLAPHFISSVDSGNLVASLYVVKSFAEKHNAKDIFSMTTKLIDDTDFSVLYNKTLDVFSIGFNFDEQKLWPFHYNSFASEARLTSFIAIAKGDAPFKHWFCLNKTLTKYKMRKGLLSWSGTAFEYFTPLIFMRSFSHTLLDETYYFAVHAEKGFMKEIDRKLPWGLSEAAYNEFDDSESYKYKAFGIPYLKIQDDKEYPIVISPYASIMAVGIDEKSVYENIKKMKDLGLYGDLGFFESYDHEDKAIVKSYYAHHQGMIMGSIANYLKNNIINEYFEENKEIKAIEILSKEKVQVDIFIDRKINKYRKYNYEKENIESVSREFEPSLEKDEYGVVSNGFYSVILNDKGLGFSKYKNLQINRHRSFENENYGTILYVKNIADKKVWSNTYLPFKTEPEKFRVVFANDRIKYFREDNNILTTTEVTVTKEHTAEIRKVTFKNNGTKDANLEMTSYSEVIMCRKEEDISHKVFNGMTIYSETDPETSSLIYSRTSRTKENTKYFVIHRMFDGIKEEANFEYETSRTKFLGRNNSTYNPDAIFKNKKLSNTDGVTLDPVMSIRKRIKLKPGKSASIYLLTGFGKSREQVIDIVKTHYNRHTADSAFDLMTNYTNTRLATNNVSGSKIILYNNAIKSIYFENKKKDVELKNNNSSQKDLWKFDISGNLPIVLVEVKDVKDISFIEDVLRMFEFYKRNCLYIDLVIINHNKKAKENPIDNFISSLIYKIYNSNFFENSLGDVQTIAADKINPDELKFLKFISRISLDASKKESFNDQLTAETKDKVSLLAAPAEEITSISEELPKDITFYNGYGGFVKEGKEYLINTVDTPAPWVNVIPGSNVGTVVTNKGGGFSYALNSREYKITSWSNDITSDPVSEQILIDDKRFIPSTTRHGFGYTVFTATTKEYNVTIKVFAGLNSKNKFYDIKINNKLKKSKKVKISLLLKMVLGVSEEDTRNYILSEFNEKENTIYFKNKYSNEFKNVSAYLTATSKISQYKDSGISINLNLEAGEEENFVFILGALEDLEVVPKYDVKQIAEKYQASITNWEEKLSTITVKTSDESFNYLINGWSLYQVFASRLYGRTGFYQVGGAIGFRDQLQDVMSILYSDPKYARNQILKHAAHQFKEGDVLHWWHEETKMGSRTRFSDDYLWLVYVTYEYIKITGDKAILNEKASFIEGDLLRDHESEKGISFSYSNDSDTLYNHLKLCINKSLSQFGRHQIPLMGSGDWNDGMNKVGEKGKGESVFVGFFLVDLLKKMTELSTNLKDIEFSKKCEESRTTLKESLNKNTWDGSWYLRAFFDNGEPLGSRNNAECKIDLVSQSWSIISETASAERKKKVIKAVEENLVDRENNIIKLLSPPFKDSKNNPGYIKDYMTGIRENGGQYTHAAIWYILSLLKEGETDLAFNYYQMINPINRTKEKKDVEKYKVEPYVIAADIYSNKDNPGKGGWTWYTGSAGWAYKVALEEMIGFKKTGDTLIIDPKLPKALGDFEINYRYKSTNYHIDVKQSKVIKEKQIKVNNKIVKNGIIKLVDDKKKHEVVVQIGGN